MKGVKTMKQIIKNNLKYLIFLAIFGLVGGYFAIVYSLQGISQEMLDEVIAQLGSIEAVILISVIQYFSYSIILGILGKILAKKIGLWRSVEFNKKGNTELIIVSLIGGAAFILFDVLIFANFHEAIQNSYAAKPTVEYIIASITYGGVIEEVMMRLFFMSLVAFLIQKISKKEEINEKILIIANVIAALLFAAGHIPATAMAMELTPIVLIRCFVMNGGFGLAFGRLYRKYGIQYAMLAHAGVHIISKLIWILCI